MKVTGFSLAILFLFSRVPAFGLAPNIFGNDHRQPMTDTAYPWRAVGYLSTGCTGALVGKNLVLTAAHCVLDSTNAALTSTLTGFFADVVGWQARGSSALDRVWWGSPYDNAANEINDWAIIRLKENLGDTFGWMGVSDESATEVTLAGYSADYEEGHTATVHVGCHFRENSGGLLLHDCDMTRGASGGPMFIMKGNTPYIVAVNVAERRYGEVSLHATEYSTLYANIAVPAGRFISVLRKLKGEE